MKKTKDIICWWSGGVTSAVAIWLAIEMFGKERVRIIFIDTFNEDADTYRFKDDCEKWYGIEIETITGIGNQYKRIQDVWFTFKSLNVATGAICSSQLKRLVREKWEKENKFTHQVFGFDIFEGKRALAMKWNVPKSKAIFPLLLHAMSKSDCIEFLKYEFITIPMAYYLGFHNNNCLLTGCVQGGIGYWQKMKTDFYFKFMRMAVIEHQLTELAGEPVTMLKDQSNEGKKKKKNAPKSDLVFLVKNPKHGRVIFCVRNIERFTTVSPQTIQYKASKKSFSTSINHLFSNKMDEKINGKIIRLEYPDGAKYCIVADSIESAKKFWETGGDYALDGDEIWREMSDDEIDGFIVNLSNFQSEAPDDNWPDNMTLRDFVKDCIHWEGKTPEIVCSTEYD